MSWSLLDQHRDADVVAFGAGGPRTRRDLLTDAARVAAALPEPTPGSHVLLVFRRDRYLFAVAMLGAWQRGHAVALPPNTRRESVWAVQQLEGTVAMVHDTDAGAPLRIDALLGGPTPADADAFAPAVTGPIATVYTSGSTGAPVAWPKTASQLVGEARMLAETFELGPGTRVAATVAPGHIYGLLFTVLVPLGHGGSLLRDVPLHVETAADRVREHHADVLVTVPAHLRGLSLVESAQLATVGKVFSSTGPLPADVADAFVARHGVPVTEILGSSETGGIAWRQRTAGETWRPLPGVSVAVDEEQRLLVSSPFIDDALPRPFRTADLAEPAPDGGFVHRGRADGVVKVGGRRVSLPVMQALLARLDGVTDAAVVAVEDNAGRGNQILAAVVGRPVSQDEVRRALRDHFEPSSLPRRVIQVDELPREDNGKLVRERVLRLFGLDPRGRTIRWDLAWGEPDRGDASFRCAVTVPETYGWYEGHFPGYPVMAGAVQLTQIVRPALERALGRTVRITELSRLKFLAPIVPGDTLDVSLDWSADPGAADFRLARGDTTCSAGRVHLSP